MISEKEFAVRQPYFPQKAKHEDFYFHLANRLAEASGSVGLGCKLGPAMRKHLAMVLTGYMQDVVSDMGLWRSFIIANRTLYGYTVPFHHIGDDYIDFELNPEDVRFLLWYDTAMLSEEYRTISPHDPQLIELADALYDRLEVCYEEAPADDNYNIAFGISLTDKEDQEAIMHLAHWLFVNSWLLSPAYALSLSELLSDPEVKAEKEWIVMQRKLEEAISQDPTGPLALYIPEWIYLLLENKLIVPKEKEQTPDNEQEHPFYAPFIKGTGGREIAYFKDYESLNNFFIEALNWEKGQKHLNQFENEHDFVLLVNRHKGMLLAKNVAYCIADPENPLYDADKARKNAMRLLTERGLCPCDLLKYIYKHGWLPDARFDESDDASLVADYWDFIARCYLQVFYRGD